MPYRFMITNRVRSGGSFGTKLGKLAYFVHAGGDVADESLWKLVSGATFRTCLVEAAATLPGVPDPIHDNEQQPHVTLFVHGFNTRWSEAVRRYDGICRDMYDGPHGLGLCVLFTWPSDGAVTHYLPDRADADRCADDVAAVLSELYRYQVVMQQRAAKKGGTPCSVKVSILAHSMGNYVVQRGMARAWTRNNQPLLLSLVTQLVMVAADVDNDLFSVGEVVDKSDGDAVANLTYRVTALYSGRDPALGISAGLKHFGKRRLGRSGLDREGGLPDNVWDLDCTPYFDTVGTAQVHSAYFDVAITRDIMVAVLRGADRREVMTRFAPR